MGRYFFVANTKLRIQILSGRLSKLYGWLSLVLIAVPTLTCADEILSDPFLQWLRWEQTANLKNFVKQTGPVSIEITDLGQKEIVLEVASGRAIPNEITKFLVRENSIAWFKHPFNTSPDVPFSSLPKTRPSIAGYLTASSSIAVRINGYDLSLKIPTDRPFGPKGSGTDEIIGPLSTYQPIKVDRREDVTTGHLRSQHFFDVSERIGEDSDLIVLPELAKVTDKKTGNGILIRDLRRLRDGHYYLPAHALPYAGPDIARRNAMSWLDFAIHHYAEPLGRMYAKMLLRYQFTADTHNPQNVLIQLDSQLKPTGRLAFRDLSDTHLVRDIIENSPFKNANQAELQAGLKISEELLPNQRHLFFLFGPLLQKMAEGEAKQKYLGEVIESADIDEIQYSYIRKASQAYLSGFRQEIESQLQIKLPTNEAPSAAFSAFLSKDEGRRSLRDYYSHLIHHREKAFTRVPSARSDCVRETLNNFLLN